MKESMCYDCTEKSNIQAFRRLPPFMRHTIRTVQDSIQKEISEKNPSRFRPTSGFRSEYTNRKYNGVMESLHRLGCARDFVPVDGDFSYIPVVDALRYKVIRSPKCWHIEVLI